MTPLQFLRSREVVTLLRRAHESTGLPISVHFAPDGQEGPQLAGCGSCNTCAHVASLPGGKRACRDSRAHGAQEARSDKRPTSFLCHMRFMCVSTPCLESAQPGFVMTIGPYSPAEAHEMLERDVRNGLSALGDDHPDPLDLSDVPVTRATAPVALARWLSDELEIKWLASHPTKDETPVEKRATRGVEQDPKLDPFQATTIAIALASGDSARVRTLALEQLGGHNRARALALGFAVIDASAQTSRDTSECWSRSDAFILQVMNASSSRDLASALIQLWRPLSVKRRQHGKRSMRKRSAAARGRYDFAALNETVAAGLRDGVTLSEVARQLGVHPTAVTHKLQRTYGISYSQYVARLRVDLAKDLLRRTKLSVRDIAARVGIDDASNLAKLFKKLERVTPLEYRDLAKKRR